jgi:hypothetical protein
MTAASNRKRSPKEYRCSIYNKIFDSAESFSVGVDPDRIYRLTQKGREFIQHWSNAANLE